MFFQVTGNGVFPFDMLRKDCCFPRNEEDSYNLIAKGHRTIILEAAWTDFRTNPTFGRWASFGWDAEVISNEVMR